MSKCSRDTCPTQNIAKERTASCRNCKGAIHLLCYGIEKTFAEIFVHENIFMICNECRTLGTDQQSPKRKANEKNLVQRTIDMQNPTKGLGSPSNEYTLNKSSIKPTTQSLIETLARKLEANTNTISDLRSSVDNMNATVNQQNQVAAESIRVNNDNTSSIKTAIKETQDLIKAGEKPTYANVFKGSYRMADRNETPKSSKPSRPTGDNKNKTSSLIGMANKTIGKPLSPVKTRQRIVRKIPEKSIWIGRLHRDTTEEDISTYIKNEWNITNVDQFQIRKLVKKDRDLSEYTFVSFKVGCSAELFSTLLDKSKWPSNCHIREFNVEPIELEGTRLNNRSPAKNEEPHEEKSPQTHQTPQPTLTDMEATD